MSNSNSEHQPVPNDAKLVSLILESLGVEDCEPRVIHQLMEFAHRYTVDVFQDALVYSEHANKNDVDLEDIRLAIQGRVNHSFTSPPPKEFLLELAEEKNKVPLPLIPEKYGIRLPPERYCLTAVNFQIVPEGTQPLPPPPHVRSTLEQSAPQTSTSQNEVSFKAQALSGAGLGSLAPTPNTASDPAWKRKRNEDDDYDF
ncbi:TFIID-31kDa-domain-containing protein [Basidiobolus meristosporus CBS 931.73]|uniref:TFIID-31kDa-domain-containing protein n=1 Tax=Basidiobolus meristosporus CBS 931.73 TaxID=1314790 RepID=A0A1Y1XTX0_9FUNG|nr:TFIID-31kDa-domain-containing protein [Basidiobolus meristosporus CBS 931.73]|eukprot:ORX89190.1 TFIID-31kDa-domain-containing protein [Basidiobolus meristosporus CBS 931.73]